MHNVVVVYIKADGPASSTGSREQTTSCTTVDRDNAGAEWLLALTRARVVLQGKGATNSSSTI